MVHLQREGSIMMITQVMVCCVGILVIRLTVADWQEEIKFESRDSTHSTELLVPKVEIVFIGHMF
jgi:hypothetical protein